MGCVGEDEYSKKMRDACKADGVDALYMVDKTYQQAHARFASPITIARWWRISLRPTTTRHHTVRRRQTGLWYQVQRSFTALASLPLSRQRPLSLLLGRLRRLAPSIA